MKKRQLKQQQQQQQQQHRLHKIVKHLLVHAVVHLLREPDERHHQQQHLFKCNFAMLRCCLETHVSSFACFILWVHHQEHKENQVFLFHFFFYTFACMFVLKSISM